jgi:Beta-lactamase enzyme family
MRPRVTLLASVAALAVLGVTALAVPPVRTRIGALIGLVKGTVANADPKAPRYTFKMAEQPAPPPPLLQARPVNISTPGLLAWALLDRLTNQMTGSANYTTATNTTESMVKAWIASDYLRRLETAGQQPTAARLAELTRMIRDSDDAAAQDIYRISGGNAVINRLIAMCGLTDTTVFSGWWSKTKLTARDAVRMGQCVADGRAAGAKWTRWILGEMRQVRGSVAEEPNGGRWGIIDALPPDVAKVTSIKNGWTLIYADGLWHMNCLAIHEDWILAVLVRFPGSLGKQHGANLCKGVTEQLMKT